MSALNKHRNDGLADVVELIPPVLAAKLGAALANVASGFKEVAQAFANDPELHIWDKIRFIERLGWPGPEQEWSEVDERREVVRQEEDITWEDHGREKLYPEAYDPELNLRIMAQMEAERMERLRLSYPGAFASDSPPVVEVEETTRAALSKVGCKVPKPQRTFRLRRSGADRLLKLPDAYRDALRVSTGHSAARHLLRALVGQSVKDVLGHFS